MKEVDIDGGAFDEAPNKKYKDFFEKFKEKDKLLIKNWKPVHMLGYFEELYYKEYNSKYKWKFNSESPSKSFEVFQIKKLSQNLSSDPETIKNYIDWAFETKVKQAKRKLTSIAFLTTENFLFEYKKEFLFSSKVSRSTELPESIKNITKDFFISNYGDLAFAISSKDKSFDSMIDKLKQNNFDFSILEKIV